MTTQELLTYQEIQNQQQRYRANGIDFYPALQSALDQATKGIKGPEAAGIVQAVVWQLIRGLEKAIENKPAKTRVGRWIRRILKAINL